VLKYNEPVKEMAKRTSIASLAAIRLSKIAATNTTIIFASIQRLSFLATSTSIRAATLVGLTFAVLFLRRPDQFLHPYIWVEDGTVILKDYLAHGLGSIIEPLGGYYVLATKLLTLTSFKLSFVWAPYLAVYLTTAFTCMVIAAIAFSPTHLPAPFLCAVAVLLVPTDAEVFAVSEYAFWWAGLLLILALLWDTKRGQHQWLRLVYIIIGGLSSPIVAVTAGLFTIRAVLERRASEYWAAILATGCAALQIWSISSWDQNPTPPLSLSTIGVGVEIFVGAYVGFTSVAAEPVSGAAHTEMGLLVFAMLGIAVATKARYLDRYFALLGLLWLGICIITAVRVPVDGIDPFIAGPRYFFYPYIILSWMLIWIAVLSGWKVRAAIAVIFVFSILQAGTKLSRRHDPIDWRDQVFACAASQEYNLPIHFAGSLAKLWDIKLTGEQCRSMLQRSLFH
jgi:hypothetical protein